MKRGYEEAYRLGTALAASPDIKRSELAGELRQLDTYFEVPRSAEESALHTLLEGIVAALEADAAWPSNGNGDGDDV